MNNSGKLFLQFAAIIFFVIFFADMEKVMP